MLQSTTTLVETAIVAGTTGSTAKTAVKYETDEAGNKTAILVDKKRSTIAASLSSTATSALYAYQDASFRHTLESVHNAQAYIESLDDEKLAELSAMLEEKQLLFETSEQAALGEVESKQPYAKK